MMMIHPDQSLMLVEGMSNKLIIDKHTPYGYKLASALVVAINIWIWRKTAETGSLKHETFSTVLLAR